MASAFGHLFAGYVLKKTATEKPVAVLFWVLLLLSTVVPDLDVIAFHFGIPYSSMWGHRGITHSIYFAMMWSLVMVIILIRRRALVHRVVSANGVTVVSTFTKTGAFFLFFLATLSHSLLDAMTNGGLGVGFFIPFENSRYFFPWTPIEVSPIGISSFFTESGLRVLASEIFWIGVPFGTLALFSFIWRKSIRAVLIVAFLVCVIPLGTLYGIALSTGLPGRRGGPQDAFRHTFSSALVARYMSPDLVDFATRIMERRVHSSYDQMDAHNNRIGILIGIGNGPLFETVLEQVRGGAVDASDPNVVRWLSEDKWDDGLFAR